MMEISCGFVILNNDNTVLIAHPTNDFMGQGIWTFPKGCIERGETHIDCAFREVYEETNLKLNKLDGEIKHLCSSKSDYREVILYLFKSNINLKKRKIRCNSFVTNGYYENNPIPEMDEYKWLSPKESLNYLSIREQIIVEKHILNT